jgi:hypothetical protein
MIDNMCLSGGADGADLQWGMCAGRVGHMVVHFSFTGHQSNAPTQEIVHLSQKLLDEADPFIDQANQTLNRKIAALPCFVRNLLRRNWYQVRNAERVYAVSTIKNGLVQGGTAWAVQMFIDHGGQEAYVFDQNADQWFVWCGEWTETGSVPEPSGVWAGIGSRDLKPNGKQAIRTLLHYQN